MKQWTKKSGCALFVSVVLFCTGITAQEPVIPEITMPVCATAPVLDGDPGDGCWSGAAVITNLFIVGENGAMTNKHTVRVMRDNAWLYVSFDVSQPAVDRNPVKYFIHDGYVQREDNVQVSFDPGTDGKLYFQFLLNRANTRADFRMTRDKGRDREGWNIPWRSAVRNSETNWSAEIALPFCLMLEVGDVSRARFNVIIDTFLPQRDALGVKLDVKKTEYSWAPIKVDFHEPEYFGRVKALGEVEFEAPFLPFVSAAAITGYRTVESQTCYGVKTTLRSCSGRGGKVALEVQDWLGDGKTNTVTRNFEFGNNVPEQEAVVYPPAASLEKREVVLLVKNPASGEVLQKIMLSDVSALDLFSAFTDRNYYTGEKQAYAVCKIGLPEAELKNTQLRAVGDGNATIAVLDEVKPETSFAVPLDKIKPGRNKVDIQLCYKDGRVASSKPLPLIKRAPRENEWKIDQVRNCLLKNGEPFFPFGLIMSGITADRKECFKEVADGHFNMIIQWHYIPKGPQDVKEYLASAEKYGLNVISMNDAYCNYQRNVFLEDKNKLLTPEQLKKANNFLKTYPLYFMKDVLLETASHLKMTDQFLLYEEIYKKCEPDLMEALDLAKTHKNLAGYFILDEPGDFSHGVGKLYYDKIHETDGYHPVFVGYSSYIDNPEQAVTWCDALGTDPYWNFGKEGERGNVNFISKIVTMNKRIADKSHKVTWTVPVAESWSQTWKRIISPAEQRCQTYLALISGSKAIIYFTYANIYTVVNWQTLCGLAKEMETLGPCCLTPAIPQEVQYSPGILDPEKNMFTDVQATLKRHPDGRYVLLAVNTTDYPVETEFTISLLADGGKVGLLFDGGTYAVNKGSFKDTLAPYADRAYVFSSDVKIVGPVKIAVNMKADKDKALREEPAIKRYNGRAGKKNILPNGSMETETVKGMPDYWSMASTTLRPEQRIGAKNQAFGSSSENPFHGKQCLLVDGNATNFNRIPLIHVGVGNDRPVTYTFSAYMRANRDGVLSEIGAHGGGKFSAANITLTKEWKRYSWTFTVPAGQQLLMCRMQFTYLGNQPDDRIWIDAAQLEKGSTPTEFEE